MKDPGSDIILCHGHSSSILKELWKKIQRKHGQCEPDELIRIFYTWITTNIRYDVDKYRVLVDSDTSEIIRSTKLDDHCFAIEALTSQKALCTGFTDLLYHMCRYSGITCIKVDGHVKGCGYLPGDKFNINQPNHQWIAVYVGQEWKLVDPTWDSGYFSRRTGLFVSRATSRYLFTSPKVFIGDHLPLETRWQLLEENIIDLNTFENQPKFGSIFHLYQFTCSIKEAVTIVSTGSTYSIQVGCDSAKFRLTVNSLFVIVRELASDLLVADLTSLTFDEAFNTAQVNLTPSFPSTFLVELYLCGTTGREHVISSLLIVQSSIIRCPLIHKIYSNHDILSDLSISPIRPRDSGLFVLAVKSITGLDLKVFVYRITNRRMIPIRGLIQNCYPERKLMFNIPEDGVYKFVIYGRDLDLSGSYNKLYTSINFIERCG